MAGSRAVVLVNPSVWWDCTGYEKLRNSTEGGLRHSRGIFSSSNSNASMIARWPSGSA